jgi:hypothetical protein
MVYQHSKPSRNASLEAFEMHGVSEDLNQSKTSAQYHLKGPNTTPYGMVLPLQEAKLADTVEERDRGDCVVLSPYSWQCTERVSSSPCYSLETC